MPFSRRAFVKTVGIGAAASFSLRRHAFAEVLDPPAPAVLPRLLPLHNNENPLGPGDAVLEALRSALGQGGPAGRYPFDRIDQLHKAIAARFEIAPENVTTGCGSSQILRTAVQMLTSPAKPLVGGFPTYEECTSYAELIGTPVRAVPLDAGMRLDLGAVAEAARGAGLLFLNNPNNPTATVLSGDAVSACIERVLRESPDTSVLVDEAYHDYVTDASYRTQVPLALKNPRLVVVRTFSKAHGMAGLRVGYAIGHAETIKKLASWEGLNSLNVAGVAAALASIKDQARLERERARNTQARQFTIDWFAKAGYAATDSQTNFIFVNVKRPAKEFREACKEKGVLIARDFPPFEKSHVRISIGTLAEMKQATAVFGQVLGAKAKAAA